MVAGRRSLARLGVAHPSCRWWNVRLAVSGRHVLDALPPLHAQDRPRGWPPGSSAVADLLARSGEDARARGWYGVEQLLGAALGAEGDTPVLAAARPQLAEVLRAMPRTMGVAGEPIPTPRVLAMGDALRPGWDIDDLVACLAAVPWIASELSESLREQLALRAAHRDASEPGFELEVWGGPEDGRRLRFERPGQLLGRVDVARHDDTLELYRPDGPIDLALSRRALSWQGGRRVHLLVDAKLHRGRSAVRTVVGICDLEPGDVLWIGEATRLAVVAIAR